MELASASRPDVFQDSKSAPHGLYIQSFCCGLDQVLQDYRQALLDLEQEILRDPHLPVSHLQYKLQDFQLLFQALGAVLDQIITHRAHGCYLLDILHRNAVCGLPKVKDALERILHVCHGVMFKQLCSWMLHGLIPDPNQEFFIQHAVGSPTDAKSMAKASPQTQEDEGDLGIMGITGRQMQALRSLTLPDVDSTADLTGHVVQAELLPSYIPLRVANKILFVGESVQMFETNQQATQHSGRFMKGREAEFTRDIQQLAQQPLFSASVFESLVDKIRTHVAEQLWVMVVQEADLTGQLRVMKDFFLLGRGELILAFIDQAQHLLKGPPTGSTEHDVNTAFQQAARNVLLENEAILQRFRLTVTTASPTGITSKTEEKKTLDGAQLNSDAAVETGWNCLGLVYTVQWPLHIFFTPSILKKYNRVFKFLLAVRRTQQDLQSLWSLQMCSKKMKDGAHPADTKMVWQLRHHMSFLVDNLQYYLQVDVIESQYGLLLDKINSTRDFEAVKLAHEHFLAALLAQSFVHMKSVSHCLYEILDLCSSVCRLLAVSTSPSVATEHAQLTTITKSFQRQSNILFRILSSVSSHNASPHLTQLLLRLDFNKYYTAAGGQLGSYIALTSELQPQEASVVFTSSVDRTKEHGLEACAAKTIQSA
ncbi:hypothetical protein C0Q70_20563 [Pomacea canaliculata]|uniref:Gamma-tubulin complex component n=1 Tax=Pomacea canaliculata TaxID=400727 RepID=A0A2T7NFW7_POMCA|nr:hypothetical protein C0Q70_20563 [Pomacea canaliculata]